MRNQHTNDLVMTWVPVTGVDGRVRMEARWAPATGTAAAVRPHAA